MPAAPGATLRAPRAPRAAHARSSLAFTADASAATVFPLFGPVREGDWLDGWSPTMVFPVGEREPADGAVFTTSDHRRHGGDAIWVMTVYDAERWRVEYVRVVPGVHVAQIAVQVAPLAPRSARVEATYRVTSLSAEGDVYVERFARDFPAEQPIWERAVNHHLHTGACLSLGGH